MSAFFEKMRASRTPYVIAEIGSNHNGDMELAQRMIVEAKAAGADCVKFQSWTKDTIFSRKVYSDNYFLSDDYRNRTDYTLEQIVEAYSVSESQLLEMRAHCDKVGIDFASTPFSHQEADFLVDKLGAEFIKVASMDLNNYPFLAFLARKGKPMVLSTGLSNLSEIDEAVRTIEGEGNREIVLLHCVSIYPPKDEQVNLNNIDLLRDIYHYPTGYSDHTLGVTAPILSATKGVCIIEKHFTLDKDMFGWDHKVSADAADLRTIVAETRRVAVILGTYQRVVNEPAERLHAFRRSIVAARDIPAGSVIGAADLDYKRPGNGLEPGCTRFIVGKSATRDIGFDEQLRMDDF